MIKLIWIAIVLCLGCKLLTRRWPWELLGPWELFGQSARSAEVRRARTLLGLPRTVTTRDQVIEAHRRLVAQVHPDRGGSGELVHEANAARDLLLDQIGNRLSEKP